MVSLGHNYLITMVISIDLFILEEMFIDDT